MCVPYSSLGSIPLQNSLLVQRHTEPSAVYPAGTRVESPVLGAYQAHSAISTVCPPTRQIGDPLAASSSSGTGRNCKGPNLESKADAEMWS